MQSNIRWSALASTALMAAMVAAMMMALAACSDSQAARTSTEPGNTGADGSYMLVTELRPASREQYVAAERSVYELCAVILATHRRAAKPFPVLAPGFVGTRTTYAGDGKRTVVRERIDQLDFVAEQAENNCEMRWSTLTHVTLTSDGKKQAGQGGVAAPYAVAQILEPLSLSVGKPVDPALFLMDKQQ